MPFPAIPIISGLVKLGQGWFSHKQAKTEAKRDVELKQITANAETDTASATDMSTSWKDEFLTLVFTAPMIVVFYASVWGDKEDVVQVKAAFATLQELPEWYLYSMIGIVIGTFGLRGLAKLIK